MEIGGATDRDTSRQGYLFRSSMLRAVSTERSGGNLPPVDVPWIFERAFTVGVAHVMPFLHDPEPVLRGLEAEGFYVWNAGNVNKGEGTGT